MTQSKINDNEFKSTENIFKETVSCKTQFEKNNSENVTYVHFFNQYVKWKSIMSV